MAEGSPDSKKQIKSFIDSYKINMDEFEPSDIAKYPTFEGFFARRHKPGSRPIYEPENPFAAVAVADSGVVTYASFPEARKLWIKGKDFDVAHLIMDRQLARTFCDGSLASFSLSPRDCHRYHSPVSGIVKRYRSMPGDDYEVDPVALHSGVDILTRNRRDYVVIKSEQFGYVLFVAIGATEVGIAQ
ncbi:phosphatidylserine decarboxylase [Candidatus Bathyarchaeota archaeon]|nr:phosphatidylserine decarboxylase [Candidatus Bathyarchaeota archaeon]